MLQLVPQLANKSFINAQKEQANPTSTPSQLVPQLNNSFANNALREQVSTPDTPSQLVPQLNNSSANNALREQASGPEAMYEIVERLVAMDPAERRTTFQLRRQKMLSDKIDCAKFLTWFIENYPASVNEVRNADESFWGRFK